MRPLAPSPEISTRGHGKWSQGLSSPGRSSLSGKLHASRGPGFYQTNGLNFRSERVLHDLPRLTGHRKSRFSFPQKLRDRSKERSPLFFFKYIYVPSRCAQAGATGAGAPRSPGSLRARLPVLFKTLTLCAGRRHSRSATAAGLPELFRENRGRLCAPQAAGRKRRDPSRSVCR